MEILYKAKDGKIFDNKYKCKLYELELESKNSKAFALNSHLDIIPITQWGKDKLYAIYIPKEDESTEYYREYYKQLEKLSYEYYKQSEFGKVSRDYYYYIPKEPGFYINAGFIEGDETYWEDFEIYKEKIQCRFIWIEQAEKIFRNLKRNIKENKNG